MSRATIRFYAELNDFLPPRRRARDLVYEFHAPAGAKEAIESLGVPHTEVELVLINGESADFNRLLADGDRLSVYPVFESFDVSSLVQKLGWTRSCARRCMASCAGIAQCPTPAAARWILRMP